MTLGYEYERPSGWGTAGDHERRIRDLEAEPCCCEDCPDAAGPGLDAIIADSEPDSFWRFDEASGSIAHDSVDGHDMDTALGPSTAPTWGQAVGPPGTTSAQFTVNTQRVSYASYPDPGANFSAGGWFNCTVNPGTDAWGMFGKGQGLGGAGQVGWALMRGGSGFGDAPSKVGLFSGNGGSPTLTVADNALSLDTWYHVMLVRNSGTSYLYVNAVLQANTTTQSPGSGTQNLYAGRNSSLPPNAYAGYGRLSYWGIWGRALSAGEIALMYTTAVDGSAIDFGKVWTAQGDGTADWDYPTIAVYTDGV